MSAERWRKGLLGLTARRRAFQLLAFAMALSLSEGVFHMACPMGGAATLGRLIEQGLFVPKTGALNLYILGVVALSAIAFGPVFCGWLCPLGAVQDWTRGIARRLGLKRGARVPRSLDKILSLGRFAVLGLILYGTQRSLSLVFSQYDPYYALMHFWAGEAAPAALAVLGTVLIAAVFGERPWCRWLCPLGGILGLLGKLRFWKPRRDAARCVGCKLCARPCPVGLDPSAQDKMNEASCVSCGLCVDACPKPGALRMGPRHLPELAAALLLAAFIALPLLVGAGHRPQAPRVAQAPAALESGGDAWAELAEGIGSRMSLAELLEGGAARGISESAIFGILGLAEDVDRETKLRDLEDEYPDLSLGGIKERLRMSAEADREDAPGLAGPDASIP
jgi:Pyruvate/2-oxoacid:ferredoxin oxidoreductase delta subunit